MVWYVQGYSVYLVCTNLFPSLDFSKDICQHTVEVVFILPRFISQLVKTLFDASTGSIKLFQRTDQILSVLPHLRSYLRKSRLDTGNLTSHPCYVIVVRVTGRKMLPLQNVFIRRVLGAATLQQGFLVKRRITLTFKFVFSIATRKECIESPLYAIPLLQWHHQLYWQYWSRQDLFSVFDNAVIGHHGEKVLHLWRLQQSEDNVNGEEEEEGNGRWEVGYSLLDMAGNRHLRFQNYPQNPEFVWIGCRRV